MDRQPTMIWLTTGGQPSLNGSLVHADDWGNRARGPALRLKPADLGIDITAVTATSRAGSVESGPDRRCCLTVLSPDVCLDDSLPSRDERFATATDHIARRFTQAVQDVPAIGNLYSPRSQRHPGVAIIARDRAGL